MVNKAQPYVAGDDQLWTVADVAEYFQCSRQTVYLLVKEKNMPVIRASSDYALRFRPQAVKDWAAGLEQAGR
jgi:excisionase family DNA binding protein